MLNLVFPAPKTGLTAKRLRLSDVWIFRERSARTKDEQGYTDDNRFKSSSVFVQPGQKLIKDMKLGFPLLSPYIRKPNVVCTSFSSTYMKYFI